MAIECAICEAPDRYAIEEAYLRGERTSFRFSRAEVETHVSHLADPEALRMSLGLAGAAAISARLRYLESQATAVLDHALTPGEDGTVKLTTALRAIRETRETLKLMAQLASHLAEKAIEGVQDSELDALIHQALSERGVSGADAYTQRQAPADTVRRPERGKEPAVPLALPPGNTE